LYFFECSTPDFFYGIIISNGLLQQFCSVGRRKNTQERGKKGKEIQNTRESHIGQELAALVHVVAPITQQKSIKTHTGWWSVYS
jgi:hypothetical protein